MAKNTNFLTIQAFFGKKFEEGGIFFGKGGIKKFNYSDEVHRVFDSTEVRGVFGCPEFSF